MYEKAVNALMKRHRDELTEEIRTLYRNHGQEVIVDVTYDVNVYPVREVTVHEARKAFEKAL
ncbi:MAG: hypothetical protein V3S51_08250 [Dehalococcoidia bacterium]